MKVTLRTETQLNINLDDLLDECVERLDYQAKRIESGRTGYEYGTLEELINDSLETMYNDNPRNYDNGQEVLDVIAKNLLLHCIENEYLEEGKRLLELK